MSQQLQKQKRYEALARKLAEIIHADEQENGKMKPSYRSPKFWAYVHHEMEKLKSDDKN